MLGFAKKHPYLSVLVIWPVVVDVAATSINKGINYAKGKMSNSTTAKTTSVQGATTVGTASQLLNTAITLAEEE